jgi:hypothetical protein
MMTFELIYAAELPSPKNKMAEIEESLPRNIELDHNANFRLEEMPIPQSEHN